MHAKKLILIFTIIIGSCIFIYGEDIPNSLNAKDSFVKLIKAITENPNTKKYFETSAGISIQPEFSTPISKRNGWRWSWSFKKDVKLIPNPNKGARAGFIPTIENDNGILFEIFIAYDHGSDLVGRDRTYIISENPPLSIGYYLKTKKDDAEFRQIIDLLIKSSFLIEKTE